MFGSSTPDGLAPINDIALIVFISSIGGLSMLWGIANILVLLKIMPEIESSQKMSRVVEVGRKLLVGAVNITKFNIIVGLAATLIFFLLIMGAVEHFDQFYYSLSYLVGSVNSIVIAVVSVTISSLVKPKIMNLARYSVFDAYDAAKRAANFQSYFFIGQTVVVLGIFTVCYQSNHNEKIKNPQQIMKIAKSLVSFSFGAITIAIGARIVNSIYAKGADYAFDTLQFFQDRLRKDFKHPALLAKALGQIVNRQLCTVLDSVGYLSAGISVAVYAASYNVIGTDQKGEIIFDFAMDNCYLPILSIVFSLFFNLLFNAILSIVIRPSTGDGIRTVLSLQRYISAVFLCGFQALAAYLCLPAEFYLDQFGQQYIRYPYHAYLSLLFGIVVCVIVSTLAEIFVTHPFFLNPVSNSCKTGSATTIIYGLSFGYLFNFIPMIFISGTLFLADYWLGVYGISLAVVGFLSMLPHYLYGSLIYSSLQNCSYISYICQLDQSVTHSLVEAAKTRKDYQPHLNFYIYGLICYFGLEIVVVFTKSAEFYQTTSLKSPAIFMGLLVGAMFPYFFNACLLRSIFKSGPAIPFDIKMQIEQIPGMANGNMDPDFLRTSSLFLFQCVLSLKRFVILLLIGPIVLVGIAGGPSVVAGFLCGTVISGVQAGISAGVSGCAWLTVKKQISFNNVRDEDGNPVKGDSEWSKAANVGNSIGQPLKDCISPSVPVMLLYWGLQSFLLASVYKNIHS